KGRTCIEQLEIRQKPRKRESSPQCPKAGKATSYIFSIYILPGTAAVSIETLGLLILRRQASLQDIPERPEAPPRRDHPANEPQSEKKLPSFRSPGQDPHVPF